RAAAAGRCVGTTLGMPRDRSPCCPAHEEAVSQRPFGAPRHAAQIGFCSCLPDRHLGGHEAMSDAALHAAADQLDADALRETIKQRVEAAETSFYWAMRLL